MLKKEFTQYPHHTDPYAKHRITDEELDFLYELQKEMNTQHSDMLTYPRIWVIQEQSKIISTMLRLILEMIRMQ